MLFTKKSRNTKSSIAAKSFWGLSTTRHSRSSCGSTWRRWWTPPWKCCRRLWVRVPPRASRPAAQRLGDCPRNGLFRHSLRAASPFAPEAGCAQASAQTSPSAQLCEEQSGANPGESTRPTDGQGVNGTCPGWMPCLPRTPEHPRLRSQAVNLGSSSLAWGRVS